MPRTRRTISSMAYITDTEFVVAHVRFTGLGRTIPVRPCHKTDTAGTTI